MSPNIEAVLKYLIEYIRANRYAPTLAEVEADTYLSRSTVSRCLDKLDEAGFIRRGRGHRAVAVLHRGYSYFYDREVA